MLTVQERSDLVDALRAEVDSGVVAALSIGNHVFLAEWCNSVSTTDVWKNAAKGSELFSLTDVPKFDTLNQGKRDSWRLMLDFAPVDFSINSMRKSVVDVWGTTDSISVLQGCRRKATHAEDYLKGASATENTVAAFKLKFIGTVSIAEIGLAFLENP